MQQKRLDKKPIVIALGGTGGHILPAMQFANDILKKDPLIPIVFAGKDLAKRSFFDMENCERFDISSSTLSFKKPWKLPRQIFCLVKGFLQALRLIHKVKPQAIVGFGSFYTFPILLAAQFYKISLFLFEPNSVLGKVNRFFAKKAKSIALQIPLLEKVEELSLHYVPFLPWIIKKGSLSQKEARESLSLHPHLWTILVFGGSQGSKYLNETFCITAKLLRDQNIDFQVIHLTGCDVDAVRQCYHDLKIPSYVTFFEKNMHEIYISADIAVCRSGAATIGELISYELPAILIPFPHSSERHQEKNAFFLANIVQGGTIFLQKKLSPHLLFKALLEEKELQLFRRNQIKEFKTKHAGNPIETLSEHILKRLEE